MSPELTVLSVVGVEDLDRGKGQDSLCRELFTSLIDHVVWGLYLTQLSDTFHMQVLEYGSTHRPCREIEKVEQVLDVQPKVFVTTTIFHLCIYTTFLECLVSLLG